ncbi:hypothetical protein BGZ54_002601, partial [Gamsiella multidivaricata]
HSATLIQDTVYFVGGLGTAATTDNSPLKSISALNLTQLLFTETPTSLGIFNHVATSNRTASASATDSAKIGVSFGQTAANSLADAIQWIDPATGAVTPNGNNVTGNGPGGVVGPLVGRSGHSLVQFGNNLWAFGGRTGTGASMAAVTDTPTFDLSAKTWSNRTKGLARYGHASARAGIDRIVSCYGISTVSATAALDSDCVFFSVSSAIYAPAELIWANDEDAISGSRTGHSLVTDVSDTNILYMFGGTNAAGTQFFQDLYKLDATKLPFITITKITQPETLPTSVVPTARAQHAGLAVGSQAGFMIVHGGITRAATGNNTLAMAGATPYFFSMESGTWIDNATFISLYAEQKLYHLSNVSVWVIIAGILAGVALLGAGVFYYIWKGLRDDERTRIQEEAAENQAGSPTSSTMDDSSDHGHKGGAERKSRSVYPLSGADDGAGHEDHSLATGPFKSTTSLLQSEEGSGKKSNKKKNQGDQQGSDMYQSSRSKSRTNEPCSPGATTLTENGSVNGYFSSSASSSAPSRLNKNNSNGSSSQYSGRQGQNGYFSSASSSTPSRLNKNNSNGSSSQYSGRQGRNESKNATGAGAVAARGNETSQGPSDSYYNPRDLCLDEDDNSSITVSLASESTMSPWAGPVRMSMDLAPPNPRFSRGAIPQVHRQLVGAVSTGHGAGNRNSNGWDTSSPGGSVSSREDGEHYRRSVNSMQWVSFEPLDMNGRPESTLYDPLSARSLTVRNASMYSTGRGSYLNNNNAHMSMYGGSSIGSDTNTEDSVGSPPYPSGPGGKHISTALAARQQRRSMRNSQDSPLFVTNLSGSPSPAVPSNAGGGDVMVTTVLPVITTKVTKPTLAKVVATQRGSRAILPSPGTSIGEEGSGGLGIDFSGFTTTGDGYNVKAGTSGGGFANAAGHQYNRRGSSTLNPAHNRGMNPTKRESKLNGGSESGAEAAGVVLQMPPPPKNNYHDQNGAGSQDLQAGLRDSILELGQDMPGFLSYGENH